MDYPITLARDDNETVLVSFPDFPEAHTYGDSVDDALTRAPEALATIIDAYIKDRRDIPLPSAITARHRVRVPALVEAKIRLYETMREAKVGKSELATRLDWHLPQVDRLLAMTHGSKLDQLEAAFRAMGKRLVIGVEDVHVPRRRRTQTRGRRRRAARPTRLGDVRRPRIRCPLVVGMVADDLGVGGSGVGPGAAPSVASYQAITRIMRPWPAAPAAPFG